mmetsp:Transcript_12836/g.19270  ORF Transcript_12836/g.19270 Transcript_12836/m.19270 type:complete len:109 (+) Transcript_12836:1321-1647(+)
MICFIRITQGSSVCIVLFEILNLFCEDDEEDIFKAIDVLRGLMTRRAGDLIDSDFVVDMQKEKIIAITKKRPQISCMVPFLTIQLDISFLAPPWATDMHLHPSFRRML